MIRKKPWNRINSTVYSCSSKTNQNNNMHILSYVTPISMKPKRYICGIYYNTQTLINIESNPEFVLQILSDKQYRLVDLLGKNQERVLIKLAD